MTATSQTGQPTKHGQPTNEKELLKHTRPDDHGKTKKDQRATNAKRGILEKKSQVILTIDSSMEHSFRHVPKNREQNHPPKSASGKKKKKPFFRLETMMPFAVNE